MALAASTIFEVNSGGSDTANGGGFDPANASMATDLAATSATGTAPVVTSASYNFSTRDNGAWLFIKGGTNWTPGWYQIASTSGNAATLTATIGSAMLLSGNVPASASTVAGCATTAILTGGTWSIDYSQSTAPGIAYTDMVIGSTTTQYTSAAKPVGPNLVGNLIAVTSGTGFTVQRVQVVSVSGITATCDKSLGTGASTGGNGGLGGALGSPGFVWPLIAGASSNNPGLVAVRNTGSPTVYSISGTPNVSGGRLVATGTAALFFGYATNRFPTNTDVPPQLNMTSGTTVVYCGGPAEMRNLAVTNTGNVASVLAWHADGSSVCFHRLSATNCATGFILNHAQTLATELSCGYLYHTVQSECGLGFYLRLCREEQHYRHRFNFRTAIVLQGPAMRGRCGQRHRVFCKCQWVPRSLRCPRCNRNSWLRISPRRNADNHLELFRDSLCP